MPRGGTLKDENVLRWGNRRPPLGQGGLEGGAPFTHPGAPRHPSKGGDF